MSDTPALSLYLLGPISYYAYIAQNNATLIDIFENYQKRSHRNRYKILSAQGEICLTIPLKKGKHQGQRIKDVKISYEEDWQKNHLRTISTCYNQSPWYSYYEAIFESVYLTKNEYLFDFNLSIHQLITKLLKLENSIEYTVDFHKERALINPTAIPKYNQVYESKFGFIPDLSILDLLFCKGPETKEYLLHIKL